MPETLTDAQKVLRNDTGIRMAAALEALASEVDPSTVIAPEYDATQTYAVGDLVIYRGVLYRCTTAITTAEAWTAAHWTATSVSDEYRQAVDQDVIDANLMALGLAVASVGDLVRVAAVDASGKPTSWRKAPLCDITTNPNLLDNWYFVGGGSQQGDGIFPINQRGKTVYPGAGYSIDRWNASNANGTLTITQDAVTLSASSSGNAFLRQLVKKLPSNAVITISALIRGSGAGVLRVDNEAGTSTIFNAQSYNNPGSAWTLISGSGTLPDGGGIVTLRANASTAIDIAAIKCEFGTEQSLAHQEGGVWVLNEIPDWAEEMAACQRYYFPIPAGLRFNATYRSSSNIDFSFSIPVRMLGTMTLTAPGIRLLASTGTDGALEQQDGFSFSLLGTASGGGFATIRANKSNHGLLAANVILIQPYTGAELSSE